MFGGVEAAFYHGFFCNICQSRKFKYLLEILCVSFVQVRNNISGTSVIFTDLSSCVSFSVELIASNRGGTSVPTKTTFTTTCSVTGKFVL